MKILAVLLSLVFLKSNYHVSMVLVNVAKGAIGNYCDKKELRGLLFDGKKKKELVEAYSDRCDDTAYIEIKTSKEYFMHYFLIYRGDGPDLGQMKYLRTQMYMRYGYDICGEHTLPTFPFNEGVQINCPPRYKLDMYKVLSNINEGLYLSEVELNYIGDNAEEKWTIYKGCFKSFTGEKSTDENVKTLYDCSKACEGTNSFLAIKNGIECYCGTAFENEDLLKSCNIKCNISKRMCGGENSYSVYLINFRLPYYDGCYMRTDLTTTVVEEDDMTPGKCINKCESEKLAWLSKGNRCQCGSDRGDSVTKREHCTAPCKGSNNNMCGSMTDNIFSVYRECFNPDTHSLSCSVGFMCGGSYNEFGICQTSCKKGFIGLYCLEREDVISKKIPNKLSNKMLYILIGGGVLALVFIGFVGYYLCRGGSDSLSSSS